MTPKQREQQIQTLGSGILKNRQRGLSVFNRNVFNEKMMTWAMGHPQMKVALFRFVDVLPSLVSVEQIADHLREYFLEAGIALPLWMRTGLGFSLNLPVTDKVTALAVKKNVEAMARGFITGNNSRESMPRLRKLWNQGFCFTVDILGEAVLSKKEALHYQSRYLELVRGLAKRTKSWRTQTVLENSSFGSVPRANVSIKLSSLCSQITNLNFKQSVHILKGRLRPVLQEAVRSGVFVYLDAEQHDLKEMILTVAEEIFFEEEFRNYPHFGVVIQAYLKTAEQDLRRVVNFSRKRSYPLSIRLVKGAYWDLENILASQRDWEVPVHGTKAETDVCYEACTDLLLQSYPKVLPALASHNVRSLSHGMVVAKSLNLPQQDVEIQMLYGMAQNFQIAVRDLGYRLRNYAPVGELLPGMAYLVRRLLENTSNQGFLIQSQQSSLEMEILLRAPRAIKSKTNSDQLGENVKSRRSIVFRNQSLLDFSKKKNREPLQAAIADWQEQFPIEVPVVSDGLQDEGLEKMEVLNPSDRQEVVAEQKLATRAEAQKTCRAMRGLRNDWSQTTARQRAVVLKRAADIMLEKRFSLMALIVLESGKGFAEADADVCEAIDFCRYYAALAEDLIVGQETDSVLGESNQFFYQPKGLSVAIAPWNFPLAILCGMTVAPLVCGNPVIMKPAEQSPAIGYQFYKILREAGVPVSALSFLPGLGEEVGAALVTDPHVHVISFTGSRAVGLDIVKRAAEVPQGQRHIKRVIAEMGGKNAVIVDDDADLDQAVLGCLQSAFGFSGQKCSALSRIIILDAVYEQFKQRFVSGLKSMAVGMAQDVSTKIGPVIDEASQRRLQKIIKIHQDRILAQGDIPKGLDKSGFFVTPTIFESDDPQSSLGQEEFFGPLVTLFKAKDLPEGIEIMNDVDYALTGGIFSRSPSHIEMVKARAEVGNLYINRNITGALVCRQPFGGFKLSGLGGKAGGPDYLLHFLEPRTVTENTMRSGFAPDALS